MSVSNKFCVQHIRSHLLDDRFGFDVPVLVSSFMYTSTLYTKGWQKHHPTEREYQAGAA